MGSIWHRSGTVERYADDIRAAGAKAYFFQGGTTTALTVYQDGGENSSHQHPVVADANGRWPDVFVPYIESYDVRVVSAFDVQLTYTQLIPNPDPVELTIEPPATGAVETGMIHCELINGTKSGYVRLNGRSIGSSASAGTERANDDTEDLFVYAWNAMSNTIAPVSGGRGASGAADFAANKTLTLPNWQGACPVGLDDMGASAGSFFSGLTFLVGNATTPGSSIGTNALSLIEANLPVHSHTGTTNAESSHTHGVSGTTGNESASHTHSGTTNAGSAHSHGITDPGHTHDVKYELNLAQGGASGFVQSISSAGTSTGTNAAVSKVTGVTVNNESTHTHGFTSGSASATHTHSFSATSGAGSSHSHTFTTSTSGSGTAINNMARSFLVTWYIRL